LVAKIMKNMDKFGLVVNPDKKRTGRRPDYNDGDLAYLAEWFWCHPTAYLDKAQEALCEAQDIKLSLSTIFHLMTAQDFTRKLVSCPAAQCNEALRTAFEVLISSAEYCNPDLFLFLDKSAVNNSTINRTYRYFEKGSRCVEQ
ncbi:hypothetical protein CYLTODRAFT_335754, partial [Cylindrobasidium torrendii FP15055 ss-10]